VNFFLKTYKKEKGRRVNSISMFVINLLLTKILQEVGIQKKKKKKKKKKNKKKKKKSESEITNK